MAHHYPLAFFFPVLRLAAFASALFSIRPITLGNRFRFPEFPDFCKSTFSVKYCFAKAD
jgi:hypothetical protein